MCGGIHYGEVERLVSIERWSYNRSDSCVVEHTMGRLRDKLTIPCHKVGSLVHNVCSLSRRKQAHTQVEKRLRFKYESWEVVVAVGRWGGEAHRLHI